MIRAAKTVKRNTRRRSAFALLVTILLITLLIAGLAELVMVTSTQAVVTNRHANTLAHELAVDSALIVLADRLTDADDQPSPLIADLDQLGQAQISLEIGVVRVTCTLRDDGAKFNPLLFQEAFDRMRLERKLTTLASRRALPHAQVDLRPILVPTPSTAPGPLYRWFDQLLADAEVGAIFSWDDNVPHLSQQRVWSDDVTFWGDGRIDLRRANVDVLEAVLEDIRPGLARLLLADRSVNRSSNALQAALVPIDAEIRQRVAARLTYDAKRYAITIDTAVGGDHRRWYVVAGIDSGEADVLHRSQLTW